MSFVWMFFQYCTMHYGPDSWVVMFSCMGIQSRGTPTFLCIIFNQLNNTTLYFTVLYFIVQHCTLQLSASFSHHLLPPSPTARVSLSVSSQSPLPGILRNGIWRPSSAPGLDCYMEIQRHNCNCTVTVIHSPVHCNVTLFQTRAIIVNQCHS